MNFNPDTTKQAQEVIFNRKFIKKVHLPLLLHNASVTPDIFPKTLGNYTRQSVKVSRPSENGVWKNK